MRLLRQCLFTLAISAVGAAQAAGYAVTNLTPAGATSSDAWDVNNLGQVVGSYSGAGFTYSRGYIWSGGAFTALTGPAGALNVNALGISDTGTVVGSYNDTLVTDDTGALVLGDTHGYVYESGSYARIDLPGAVSTVLRGISANARYVSGYGTFADSSARGFLFDRNTGAFALVGSSVVGAFTIVQGINNWGQLVGDERVPAGSSGQVTRTSFIYDMNTGTRTDQNLPGTTRTAYRDINDAGQIAGFLNAGGILGFTGTPASFQTFSFGSLDNTLLEGINNAGWLVGVYAVADGVSQGILLTPVPEPSVWLLSLAGLGVVGWQLRRRRA